MSARSISKRSASAARGGLRRVSVAILLSLTLGLVSSTTVAQDTGALHRDVVGASDFRVRVASALALASMSPAAADPKPTDDSWQTSVCDNGETYGFPVVYHAADPASESASLHCVIDLSVRSIDSLHGRSLSSKWAFVISQVGVATAATQTPVPAAGSSPGTCRRRPCEPAATWHVRP